MITINGQKYGTLIDWLDELQQESYVLRAEIDKLDVQQTKLHHRLKWLREQLGKELSTTEEK